MIIATARVDKLPKQIRMAVKDAYRLLLNTVLEVRDVFRDYGIEFKILKGRKYGSIAVLASSEDQGYVANGVKHAVERELPRAIDEIVSALKAKFTLLDHTYRVFGYRWLDDGSIEEVWIEPRYVMYGRIFNISYASFGTYFNIVYVHADAHPRISSLPYVLLNDARDWLRHSDYVVMDGEYMVESDMSYVASYRPLRDFLRQN